MKDNNEVITLILLYISCVKNVPKSIKFVFVPKSYSSLTISLEYKEKTKSISSLIF